MCGAAVRYSVYHRPIVTLEVGKRPFLCVGKAREFASDAVAACATNNREEFSVVEVVLFAWVQVLHFCLHVLSFFYRACDKSQEKKS